MKVCDLVVQPLTVVLRWVLATAFTHSQGAGHLFRFAVKQRVVFLPAMRVWG